MDTFRPRWIQSSPSLLCRRHMTSLQREISGKLDWQAGAEGG